MATPKIKLTPLPSQEELLADFRYDEATGKLYWRTRYGGREAFCQKYKNGYLYGTFRRKKYLAHRVIWKIANGFDPQFIDHDNGVRDRNLDANLRSVDFGGNMRNAKRRVDNTSGMTGVSWSEATQKWRVMISAMGRRNKHIGLYLSLEEAIKSRKEAEVKYGYHHNHGRSQ
jgi:hypothetical protein